MFFKPNEMLTIWREDNDSFSWLHLINRGFIYFLFQSYHDKSLNKIDSQDSASTRPFFGNSSNLDV